MKTLQVPMLARAPEAPAPAAPAAAVAPEAAPEAAGPRTVGSTLLTIPAISANWEKEGAIKDKRSMRILKGIMSWKSID